MSSPEVIPDRSAFFMAASHQLKSPVAIAQWCIQSVLENKQLPPDDASYLEKAVVQLDAMSHLIADMLHMFRVDAERTLVQVELNPLLEEILVQYAPVAERKGVRLVRTNIETVPTVLGDAGYLKQALLNLVDNAIKYSASGTTVGIELVHETHSVRYSVTDQGIGISDLDQQKLFTEFFRTEEARKVAHDGTGLGLVLVKRIVEQYGGSVHLTSEAGKGSVFTLEFPVS
jgi:signal transduction histidine kinase